MKVVWSSFHNKYNEQVVKKYAPLSAGVYLLWVQLKDNNWKCFYVGRAKNLEDRLLSHLGTNEENNCIKKQVKEYICGFEYTKITLLSNRKGIEKFLYGYYKPECNNLDPGGTPTTVNLP